MPLNKETKSNLHKYPRHIVLSTTELNVINSNQNHLYANNPYQLSSDANWILLMYISK